MPKLTGGSVVERLDEARKYVLAQLEERNRLYPEFGPAWPWTLVVRAHSYVFRLPAEELRRIRLHADIFNGMMGAGHYLIDVQLDAESAVAGNGYAFLGEDVPKDFWAREYDLPGMEEVKYGYNYRGFVVNAVTAPRQQNVCNLYRLTQDIDRDKDRIVFVEIGGGYGSLALDVRRVFPNCAYSIFDLPESLIFSASYLITHRPDLRVYVYAPGDDLQAILADFNAYDFAFIPNYLSDAISNYPHIDIALNSVSFPEMSEESVRRYLKNLQPKLRRFFMSINCRFPQNDQPGRPGTDDVLADYFPLYPLPENYRSLTSAQEYDNQGFRPVFLGTTPACRPLPPVALRWVTPNGRRYVIKPSRKGGASMSLS